MGRGSTLEPPRRLFEISIFWFVQLHQNLPQYFRRNHVADTILIFLNYFAEPCRRCIWGISSKPRRRFIIFDDDLGHGNHSGELLLFVGCIVNFIVSYLICMFQDSVPAGSYNDPFLSSVCPVYFVNVDLCWWIWEGIHNVWLVWTDTSEMGS